MILLTETASGPAGGSRPPVGTPFLLSLGSNLGDRRAHLESGLRSLAVHVQIEAVSRVVESEAWGPVSQGSYLNLVVRGRTVGEPAELLRIAQEAEAGAGRRREVRYGPRTLDVDLLFFGDLTSDDPKLTLPHPHWEERPFVHALVREVAGDVVDPRSGVPLAQLVPGGVLPDGLREVEPLGGFPGGEGAR